MDLVGPLINVDSFRGSSFGNRTGKSTYDEKNESMILSFHILNYYNKVVSSLLYHQNSPIFRTNSFTLRFFSENRKIGIEIVIIEMRI